MGIVEIRWGDRGIRYGDVSTAISASAALRLPASSDSCAQAKSDSCTHQGKVRFYVPESDLQHINFTGN